MKPPILPIFALAAVLAAATGCSSSGDTKAEYKKAQTLPSLEVPPDLTTPEARSAMDVPQLATASAQDEREARPAARDDVLPRASDVRVLRDGDMRWLQVDANVDAVWREVREFWRDQGFELTTEDPTIGVMETQWAENRADIPEGIIRGILSTVLDNMYSAPTRDKFRVRLERGPQSGTTEVYLTHYGVEEVVVSETETRWQPRPSDPELVNEMLNRLMVYLGVKQDQADALLDQAQSVDETRTRLESGPPPYLWVADDFPRAWRRTGIALDRLGLVVEDRNRSDGVYYVRQVDLVEDAGAGEGSWFSNLFGGGDEQQQAGRQLRIFLTEADGGTRVTIAAAAESRALEGDDAERLLRRLRDELQ